MNDVATSFSFMVFPPYLRPAERHQATSPWRLPPHRASTDYLDGEHAHARCYSLCRKRNAIGFVFCIVAAICPDPLWRRMSFSDGGHVVHPRFRSRIGEADWEALRLCVALVCRDALHGADDQDWDRLASTLKQIANKAQFTTGDDLALCVMADFAAEGRATACPRSRQSNDWCISRAAASKNDGRGRSDRRSHLP